jgi:hypothetical protein
VLRVQRQAIRLAASVIPKACGGTAWEGDTGAYTMPIYSTLVFPSANLVLTSPWSLYLTKSMPFVCIAELRLCYWFADRLSHRSELMAGSTPKLVILDP